MHHIYLMLCQEEKRKKQQAEAEAKELDRIAKALREEEELKAKEEREKARKHAKPPPKKSVQSLGASLSAASACARVVLSVWPTGQGVGGYEGEKKCVCLKWASHFWLLLFLVPKQ